MEAKQTSTNYRARVNKYAWQLRKSVADTWRESITKAWQLYHLAKAMRAGVVTFTYQKADGTIRVAKGTLRNLPAGITNGGKKVTKPSYKTLAYFDVEKQAFRSFKIENLISVA